MTQPVPYWSGDGVTLYHGRCENILPHIQIDSVDALVTDPPYFQVKDDDWDNQWAKVEGFLSWLGQVTDLVKPTLRAHSSVWMFASPELTPQVERMLAERFRILNSVRWVKPGGSAKYLSDPGALRRLLKVWEGVLFAEQFADAYGDVAQALHQRVFAPIGRYIQQERERSGMTQTELSAACGFVLASDPTKGTVLCLRWERGDMVPTAETYARMRAALGPGYLRREYEDLRREYEDLRREYEDLRRPFHIPRHGPRTDVWDFQPVPSYPGKHPCEKPQGMLRYMIEMSSRPGAVILDPFAGSGSALLAARDLGRQAIGIEQDEHWCAHAARKLNQTVLNFDEASA